MRRRKFLVTSAGLALGSIAAGAAAAAEVEPMLVTPSAMRSIATIDERFLSYNVEMAEVIGGNFWKPYTAESIAAMKALGGATSPDVAGQNPTWRFASGGAVASGAAIVDGTVYWGSGYYTKMAMGLPFVGKNNKLYAFAVPGK